MTMMLPLYMNMKRKQDNKHVLYTKRIKSYTCSHVFPFIVHKKMIEGWWFVKLTSISFCNRLCSSRFSIVFSSNYRCSSLGSSSLSGSSMMLFLGFFLLLLLVEEFAKRALLDSINNIVFVFLMSGILFTSRSSSSNNRLLFYDSTRCSGSSSISSRCLLNLLINNCFIRLLNLIN